MFGNTYKESSLEMVVRGIAEQRQMFKGADHPFHWKPKLRIPDIYEDRGNQLAFGRLLETCRCCTTEAQVLAAIDGFAARGVRGLGPSAANLLSAPHDRSALQHRDRPRLQRADRSAGQARALGRLPGHESRVLALNEELRDLLSSDLGALAGLQFDIGAGRISAPPLPGEDSAGALSAWREELRRAASPTEDVALTTASRQDTTHTEVHGWLRDLGRALGFQVWIASNDRSRPYDGGRLADGCLASLPSPLVSGPAADAIRLIDVLWLAADGTVAAAFEVEHTTSIYSGIVRMLDLALSGDGRAVTGLYLVAPDEREHEVRAQLRRPGIQPGCRPPSALPAVRGARRQPRGDRPVRRRHAPRRAARPRPELTPHSTARGVPLLF